ncbi:MAG: hypothetical protein EOO91_19690 [Pedobacter sp.]|nr:MAG: hypothetical protein EOO91_19690 [Pedobacter sp.]
MKTFLLLTLLSLTFSLKSNANHLHGFNVHQSDTLKKGKNYILFSKSENVGKADFSKNKKPKENKVYIRFGFPTPIPTSNAINSNVISSKRYNEDGSIPIFEKIDILEGKYEGIVLNKDTKVRNLYTLTDVEFPLHLKLNSGAETIEFELTEAGEWDILIELKNN